VKKCDRGWRGSKLAENSLTYFNITLAGITVNVVSIKQIELN